MNPLRHLVRSLFLLFAAAGLARDARAIVGGAPDSGDPAVAVMFNSASSSLCSGTVIAPQVFLTAAGCIADDTDASHYAVRGGADPFTTPDWSVDVTSVVPNPAYDSMTLANNTGVLLLASAPPVTPLRWLASDPGGSYSGGNIFTAVGYGVTNAVSQSDAGLKRTADLSIVPVDGATFSIDASSGKSPCYGDTGGPALELVNSVETVIATVSNGDPLCAQFATYDRTDAAAPFIASYAPEPGATACGAVAAAALASAVRRRSQAGEGRSVEA